MVPTSGGCGVPSLRALVFSHVGNSVVLARHSKGMRLCLHHTQHNPAPSKNAHLSPVCCVFDVRPARQLEELEYVDKNHEETLRCVCLSGTAPLPVELPGADRAVCPLAHTLPPPPPCVVQASAAEEGLGCVCVTYSGWVLFRFVLCACPLLGIGFLRNRAARAAVRPCACIAPTLDRLSPRCPALVRPAHGRPAAPPPSPHCFGAFLPPPHGVQQVLFGGCGNGPRGGAGGLCLGSRASQGALGCDVPFFMPRRHARVWREQRRWSFQPALPPVLLPASSPVCVPTCRLWALQREASPTSRV
jgi:hypothetical protein